MIKMISCPIEFESRIAVLQPEELFRLQDQLWHYAIWKGRSHKSDFSRHDLTKHLEPCADYMYKVGCTFDLRYCRAKICYRSNQNCALRKTRGVIRTLRKVILSGSC